MINTATRSVLGTVSTGSSGVSPFALAPEGGYVFAGLANNAIAVSAPFGGPAASFVTRLYGELRSVPVPFIGQQQHQCFDCLR